MSLLHLERMGYNEVMRLAMRLRPMKICFALSLLLILAAVAAAATTTSNEAEVVVHGKIQQEEGKPPVVVTDDHKTYQVSGDEFLEAQMKDSRLNGRAVELRGHENGPGKFAATHLYTVKDGKRYDVTYWCDVCSIRTHMPGRCMCCQGPTELQEILVP